MEYKKLGRTDLEVSRIGFGCWAIGGHGYGRVDDERSILTIREAVDKGINFFDTSNVYGFGHSEEVLGKAFNGKVGNVVIATKFGVNWDAEGRTYKDCSPKMILDSLHGSLRRLKVDSIPLYQIHWYDNRTPFCDIMETLEKCKEQGKIRYAGCTNFSFDLIAQASSKYRLESLQAIYNIIHRQNHADMMKCAQELNMGVIAYSVLARGLLSGKFTLESKFGENDTRSREEDFLGKNFEKNIEISKELKTIGKRYGKTATQVSIRWVLSDPAITCAIVGVKDSAQLSENMGGLGWKMSEEDNASINRILGAPAGDQALWTGGRR